jgi:hypothetical protein
MVRVEPQNTMPAQFKTAGKGRRRVARPWRRRRTGDHEDPYSLKPVIEFPEPLWKDWDNPADFQEALDLHIRRHGENVCRLHKALPPAGDTVDRQTLYAWVNGILAPRSAKGLPCWPSSSDATACPRVTSARSCRIRGG